MTKTRKHYDRAPYEVLIVKYSCDNCCRRWQSANGNLDDYQLCKNCYTKCYPGTYKYQAPNKRGNQNRETFIAHNKELCGKCIRLGYSCMEAIGEERSGTLVSNLEGDEITLENADFSQYFTMAEKKKTEERQPERRLSKKEQQLKERREWAALMDAGKKKKVEEKKENTSQKSTDKRVTSMEDYHDVSIAIKELLNIDVFSSEEEEEEDGASPWDDGYY